MRATRWERQSSVVMLFNNFNKIVPQQEAARGVSSSRYLSDGHVADLNMGTCWGGFDMLQMSIRIAWCTRQQVYRANV